jgi:hypothetical protein
VIGKFGNVPDDLSDAARLACVAVGNRSGEEAMGNGELCPRAKSTITFSCVVALTQQTHPEGEATLPVLGGGNAAVSYLPGLYVIHCCQRMRHPSAPE